MIMSLFEYPLPNNGERYDLSREELVALLQKAYDNGWNYGYQTAQVKYDTSMTTWASSEDIDDNTKWKEVWIK